MNELSLFTGIGGGLLGTKLLGWRCIGAVDNDEYCCQVLEQRIKDGCFEPFNIFCMDIREFNRRVAPIYRGKVDVISAGFPCQPFSVAGKGLGDQDERNMWPATIECIRLVRPRHLLLENVPGLLTHEYVRRIYGDLAESGYCVKWRCLSAAEVGANHKRNRWWIVADNDSPLLPRTFDEIQAGWNTADTGCAEVAESDGRRLEECSELDRQSKQDSTNRDSQGRHTNGRCDDISDAPTLQRPSIKRNESDGVLSQDVPDTELLKRDGSGRARGRRAELADGSWWSVEPDVGRLADGIPSRVDRLKSLGNAQVPAVVAAVWRLLNA